MPVTRTFSTLEVSKEAMDEIRNKLKEAGCEDRYVTDDGIVLFDVMLVEQK